MRGIIVRVCVCAFFFCVGRVCVKCERHGLTSRCACSTYKARTLVVFSDIRILLLLLLLLHVFVRESIDIANVRTGALFVRIFYLFVVVVVCFSSFAMTEEET